MQFAIIILVVGIPLVALVVASSRMERTNRAYPWALYAPRLMAPIAMLWIGFVKLPTDPGFAFALGLAGVGLGALVIRLILRTRAGLLRAETEDDVTVAVTEPNVDYLMTYAIFSVLGVLGIGILLIFIAVSQGGL